MAGAKKRFTKEEVDTIKSYKDEGLSNDAVSRLMRVDRRRIDRLLEGDTTAEDQIVAAEQQVVYLLGKGASLKEITRITGMGYQRVRRIVNDHQMQGKVNTSRVAHSKVTSTLPPQNDSLWRYVAGYFDANGIVLLGEGLGSYLIELRGKGSVIEALRREIGAGSKPVYGVDKARFRISARVDVMAFLGSILPHTLQRSMVERLIDAMNRPKPDT